MIRLVAAGALAVAIASGVGAPIQCGHGSSSEGAREDSPGDALWSLAEDFKAHGNDEAAKQTLKTLVEKYPSNRHAPAARDALAASK